MPTIRSNNGLTVSAHWWRQILDNCCGMFAHTAWSAYTSYCNGCTVGCFLWMRLSNSSQRCSIGFKSDDKDGHGRTLMLFRCRNAIVVRAVCGLAFSCWKVLSLFCIIGRIRHNNTELSDYHWCVPSWYFYYVIWLPTSLRFRHRICQLPGYS